MTSPLLLLIDDDVQLTRRLSQHLRHTGYHVLTANSIDEAKLELKDYAPDLIILDWNMPRKDGLSFLGQWRATEHQTPILMLSGNVSVQHKVLGIKTGADDYLAKPFDIKELEARIESLLRRSRIAPASRTLIVEFGPYRFDIDAAKLNRNEEQIDLALAELQLLSVLCRHANKVLSRERLLQLLGDLHSERLDRSIDLRIARLRSKLEDDARDPRWIVTVRGQGYRLDGTVLET